MSWNELTYQPVSGTSVWLAYDNFGKAVTDGLGQWLEGIESTDKVRVRNRLIDFEVGDSDVTGQVQSALTDLLRLRGPDGTALEPHLWIVLDSSETAVEEFAKWLGATLQKLLNARIYTRTFILLRHLSNIADEKLERTRHGISYLLENVVAGGKPGAGRTICFVVTDRRSDRTTLDVDDSLKATSRFVEFAFLSAVSHSAAHSGFRAFNTDLGAAQNAQHNKGSELPVFASFAVSVAEWSMSEEENRILFDNQRSLVQALMAQAQSSWKPPKPEALELVDLTSSHQWPTLDVPRWSPRMWNHPQEEYLRVFRVLGSWSRHASSWRTLMIERFVGESQGLSTKVAANIGKFRQSLTQSINHVLKDKQVPGLMSPLSDLLSLSKTALIVQQEDLKKDFPHIDLSRDPLDALVIGQHVPPEDSSVDEAGPTVSPGEPATDSRAHAAAYAVDKVPDPSGVYVKEELALREHLERRLNPVLLVLVAVSSALLMLLWIVTIVDRIQHSALSWVLNRFGLLSRRLPLSWREHILGTSDVQLVDPARLWLWTGLGVFLVFLLVTIVTLHNEQLRIERLFLKVSERSTQWQNNANDDLVGALESREIWSSNESIEHLKQDIDNQMAKLTELAKHKPGTTTERHISLGPDALRLSSTAPIPGKATSEKINQALMIFRNSLTSDKWPDDATDFYDALFSAAGQDRQSYLSYQRDEFKNIKDQVRKVMPSTESVLVLPHQVHDGANYQPSTYSLLGMPELLLTPHPVDLEGVDAEPVSLPVKDAFYAVVIQRNFTAAQIFGSSVNDGAEA